MKTVVDEMTPRISKVEQVTDSLTQKIDLLEARANKLERFSWRNNFRIVGFPETAGENSVEIVHKILQDKFGMETAEIERAHRDGRRIAGKSLHIIVKILR